MLPAGRRGADRVNGGAAGEKKTLLRVMATVSPARQAGNIADAAHDVVYAMFRGLVEGGGSRHVIAASAAAVLRTSMGSIEKCGGIAPVKVPEEVHTEVKPIAAVVAVQKPIAAAEGIEQDLQVGEAWPL